jgi:ABC-type nitrate/sulfonate/bicarbonate transport system permease component
VLRARRTPDAATPILLVAAVVLTLGSGLADITALDRSQLPTTLSHSLDRTFVALVLGASVGVLVTAARRLRGAPRPAVTVPATPPAHA